MEGILAFGGLCLSAYYARPTGIPFCKKKNRNAIVLIFFQREGRKAKSRRELKRKERGDRERDLESIHSSLHNLRSRSRRIAWPDLLRGRAARG
jgi:hypothetical protein